MTTAEASFDDRFGAPAGTATPRPRPDPGPPSTAVPFSPC